MIYSCSAVSVRRGGGATTGGGFTWAPTVFPDTHNANGPASSPANPTTRKVERRSLEERRLEERRLEERRLEELGQEIMFALTSDRISRVI